MVLLILFTYANELGMVSHAYNSSRGRSFRSSKLALDTQQVIGHPEQYETLSEGGMYAHLLVWSLEGNTLGNSGSFYPQRQNWRTEKQE